VGQQKEAVRPSSVERMIEDLRAENALLRKLVADLALATAKLKERLEGKRDPGQVPSEGYPRPDREESSRVRDLDVQFYKDRSPSLFSKRTVGGSSVKTLSTQNRRRSSRSSRATEAHGVRTAI